VPLSAQGKLLAICTALLGFTHGVTFVALVRCITCFQSGLDAVRASNEHFVGVVVLWKQMIRCTSCH
jgi:hypothetical protein